MHPRSTQPGTPGNQPMTDDQVMSEIQRALHDIRPLLEFHTQPKPIEYEMTTITRLTLGGAHLPSQPTLRPRED